MKSLIALLCLLPLGLLAEEDPHQAFEFWLGEWSVNNRYLQDDAGWKDGGPARARITPVLGGRAVFEEWRGEGARASLFGMSLRAYDTDAKDWALLLNWPGGGEGSFGVLRGEFRHGRGEFFSGSGKNLTRYSFSDALSNSIRWDSSRTNDGGRNWLTDWIMEFTRSAPAAESDAAIFEEPWMDELIAKAEAARELDFLQGTWTGIQSEERSDGTTSEHPATLRVAVFLKGWAIVESLEVRPEGGPVRERLTVRGYVPSQRGWESWSLTRADTRFEKASGRVKLAKGNFKGRGPRGAFTEEIRLEKDGTLVFEEERELGGKLSALLRTELALED